MKKYILLLLLFITQLGYSQSTEDQRVPGNILVQLNTGIEVGQWVQSLQNNSRQATSLQHSRCLHPGANMHLLFFDENAIRAQDMLSIILQSPQVANAQFNHELDYRDGLNPNDPMFNEQWALPKIDAPEAWEVTTGGLTFDGDTIVVAVMDGGCQLDHPDLADNIWVNNGEIPGDGIDPDGNNYTDDYYGLRISSQTDNHDQQHKHGTRVTGIIGAKGNDGTGIAGINWAVKLMILSDVRFEDQVVEAMFYTYELRKKYNQTNGREGAFVVAANYSLGVDNGDCVNVFTMWNPTLDSLGSEGILVTGATADRGWNVEEEGDVPTTCTSDFLIAVTSSDQTDTRVSTTAYGPISIDLAAPGNGTLTTDIADGYFPFPGTSAATPHVAGAIGLLYSYPCDGLAFDAKTNPEATARLMKKVILDGVDHTDALIMETVSGGRLNINNSLKLLEAEYGQEKGPLGFVEVKPNPVRDLLTVTVSIPDFADYEVKLYDAVGRRIADSTIPGHCSSPFFQVDVSSFQSGVYFLTLENPNNIVSTRFVVQ